jgi:hypothetical protein
MVIYNTTEARNVSPLQNIAFIIGMMLTYHYYKGRQSLIIQNSLLLGDHISYDV